MSTRIPTDPDRLDHWVSPEPFAPQAVEELSADQERYYMASQWRMMWWRLKRHKLAVASGISTDEEVAEKAREAEVLAYLEEHMGACRRVLGDFLQGASAEQRAQFVYEPVRVASLMSRSRTRA